MKIHAAKAALNKEWEKLEKISAWNLAKVRIKIWRDRWSKKRRVLQFSLRSVMDICHLKNAELEKQSTNSHKGRVVLWGDIVKDDSGSCAAFTEQGSSASQMTAAKSHGYCFKVTRIAQGQAGDALSAYTQVRMEDGHEIIEKFPNRHVQTFGFVYHDTNGLNHGPVWKAQSLPLERNLYGHPLGKTVMGKANWRKSYCSTVGRRFPNWECLYSFIVKKDYSYLCMWMTWNWLERNKIIDPMWKCTQ